MLKHSSKGITLIEMVMAMVILLTISIPTASMIGAQIEGITTASNLTAAGNAGRLAMEKLNNTPYASITTGISVPGNALVVGFYEVTWNVTETVSGSEAEKNIEMVVRRNGAGPVLVTLYNTFCKGVSYGT